MATNRAFSVAAPVGGLQHHLGKPLDCHALSLLVKLTTDPRVRSLVIDTTRAIITEAGTGRSILADPSKATANEKGAIEIAIDALHSPPDDDRLLSDAFAGKLGDLADLPDTVLQYRMLPLVGAWLQAPGNVLATWLRSTENAAGKPLYRLDKDIGVERARLADLLHRIRGDEEVRPLVHGGYLGQALRLGRPFGDLTIDESEDLIRGFARVLAVVIAHFRTALLRRWSRMPMTELIPFAHDWQTLARCMMSSVVAPAAAIMPILKLSKGPQAVADLPGFLEGTPLDDAAFMSMITDVAPHCPSIGSGAHGFDRQIARLQAEMVGKARKVARIRHKDLVADGLKLGQMSFVKDRLEVSASHGSVLIAWSLLSAPEIIDACVSATRAGLTLPDLPRPTFMPNEKTIGFRKIVRSTDHLRREIRPDSNSADMGAWTFNNAAGVAMTRKALSAFRTNHPTRAIAALWIDPRVWFA